MKKFLYVSLFILAGCTPVDPNKEPNKWDRRIWIDPETKCEYLFWQNSVPGDRAYAMTLTPRIGKDRLPVCNI